VLRSGFAHLSPLENAQAQSRRHGTPGAGGGKTLNRRGARFGANLIASRYWGLTPQEYYDAADLWPLDPEGNILI